MLNRQIMPVTGRFPDFVLPPVIAEQIAPHCRLVALPNNTQPIVLLNVALYISDWDTKRPGMARLMAKLLTRGTKKRSASTIADMIEQAGATIHVRSTKDVIHLQMHALSNTFLTLLPLVVDILANPVFAESEVAVIKKRLVEELKQERASIGRLASLELASLLFGEEHPYGYQVRPNGLKDITATDLQQCYQRYAWQKCQIFLTGDIDEKMLNITKEAFGSIKSVSVAVGTYPIVPGIQKQCITKESMQGAIGIGRPLITRSHKDYPALYVTNTILGGYFGSRLMRNIREEKGYSYGVSSFLCPLRRGGYWQVVTQVKKNYIEATCTEIYREIERLQHTLVEEQELVAVQNYLIGQLLGGFNDLFATTRQLCSVYLHSLDIGYYLALYRSLQQITPQTIQHMACQYLDMRVSHQVIIR